MRFLLFAAFNAISTVAWAQSPDGRMTFQSLCSGCHGTDGNGGEHAPSILPSLAAKNDEELHASFAKAFREKACRRSSKCPMRTSPRSSLICGRSSGVLAAAAERPSDKGPTYGWSELEGFALGRTGRELQLRTDDQRIHLLRKAGEQYRRVTTQADWPSMHGQLQRKSILAR